MRMNIGLNDVPYGLYEQLLADIKDYFDKERPDLNLNDWDIEHLEISVEI